MGMVARCAIFTAHGLEFSIAVLKDSFFAVFVKRRCGDRVAVHHGSGIVRMLRHKKMGNLVD